MRRMHLVVVAVVAVVLPLALSGCGGGGSSDPGNSPQQPGGAVNIQGWVVAADQPTQVLPQATVTLQPHGITVTADGLGRFFFTAVPAGQLILEVNPAYHADYVPAAVIIPAQVGASINLSVALLPREAGNVVDLWIAPRQARVEVGGQMQFAGQIVTDRGATGLSPTWLEIGPAGTMSAAGLFVAGNAPGVSDIYAFSGTASTSTTVTVVGPRGPMIGEFIVNPVQLGPSGGTLTITAALNDAQGVKSSLAEIIYPTGATDLKPLTLVPGEELPGSFLTYRSTYLIPPNTNPTDPTGAQAPQVYEVRALNEDNDGRTSESGIVRVTVEGVQQPPPPPAAP